MSYEVIDALGRLAEAGQHVAFGEGGKGAQPLKVGVISKVNPKTVEIAWKRPAKRWESSEADSEGEVTRYTLRSSLAFVQVLP